MTLRLLSWAPATAAGLVELVGRLAPVGGFVALGGPEAAWLLDRDAAEPALAEAGDRWAWGRAFDPGRELLWRCEGDRRLVVLALDGDPGPAPLPAGAEECRPAPAWAPVAHDPELRPGRLLLWRPGDQRLPRAPVLPGSLSGAGDLAIEIQEYDGPDGVAWRRYRRVVGA